MTTDLWEMFGICMAFALGWPALAAFVVWLNHAIAVGDRRDRVARAVKAADPRNQDVARMITEGETVDEEVDIAAVRFPLRG